MVSYDDKIKAVKLYYKYGKKLSRVIRELGYPKSCTSLRNWIKEYEQNSDLRKDYSRKKKYSEDDKSKAVNHYLDHGKNMSYTLSVLGYPNRHYLKQWIIDCVPDQFKGNSYRVNMVQYSLKEKQNAVNDLLIRETSSSKIATTVGVSTVTLYNWKNQLLGKEYKTNMKQEIMNIDEGANTVSSEFETSVEEINQLKSELKKLKTEVLKQQMELDALKLASELLKKKSNGLVLVALKNAEKSQLINQLKFKYRISDLLLLFTIPKSSFYYHLKVMRSEDKYAVIRSTIIDIFKDNRFCYGYRRIRAAINNMGIILSEKVIRRIMKKEKLIIKYKRTKKYNSYQGELSQSVPNHLNRDFHADKPNEKWLTDITEFHIPRGKVYLSPIVDCFDGLIVSWNVGTAPNAKLVNDMLHSAIATLDKDEKPFLHSDRGAHYRWPEWIAIVESRALIRSMSKKGCSPDNSACEGFFGRLKNEFFYHNSWSECSIQDFIDKLNGYIEWYNNKRIKISLKGKSPIEYRQSLGLI